MTNHLLIALLLCLQPGLALAQSSFTALASGQSGESYAGVKVAKKGEELSSYLFRIDAKSLKARPLKLPKDLKNREIVAILPSERQLYIVTQWTLEQGDNALVDVYDLEKKSWNKVDTANCNSFDRLAVQDNKLVFHCSKIGTGDTEHWEDVALPLGTNKITARPEIKLPQNSATHDGTRLTLSGAPNAPEQLKILSGKKRFTLRAGDLVKNSRK
ncbi:MAG: hypothetical protein HY074_15695 [Deltaproteobacteria bacterium]|nr:hypothetical protein [Deltaproteobacteria bacterium]